MNDVSKKMLAIACITFVMFGMIGCSTEYVSNMDAKKQIAWVQTTNQRLAVADVMAVITKIITPIEDEWEKQNGVAISPTESDPYHIAVTGEKIKALTDSQYAMQIMGRMMGKMIEWSGRAELARARSQAVQYLTPIIQAIYSQNLTDFGTPMTTNEVYSKLVDQIPFVATVGGMYSLGAKGISAAGDSIAAAGGSTINTNSNIVSGGSSVGSSGASSSVTTTTEYAPAEVATEVTE